MKNYLFNLLVVFDEVVNTIFGGYPDETISLRTARERDINGKTWARIFCKFLDLFQKDHCSLTETSKRQSIRYRNL